MKKSILTLLCLVSVNCFAAKQYIINHTKSDVVLEYEICNYQNQYDPNTKTWNSFILIGCDNKNQITIPAMNKINSPYPLDEEEMPNPPHTFDYKRVFLVSISSPANKFTRVDIPDQIEYSNCVKNHPAAIDCRMSRIINHVTEYGGRSMEEALVIEDYDLGFVNIEEAEIL